jgi:hypothetical protein
MSRGRKGVPDQEGLLVSTGYAPGLLISAAPATGRRRNSAAVAAVSSAHAVLRLCGTRDIAWSADKLTFNFLLPPRLFEFQVQIVVRDFQTMQNMRLLVRASQGGVRKAVGRVALPPPQAESDEEWRAMTGCMELPAVLRERALVLLRKRAGKERLGLRRMVEKHRPARAKQDAGLPFTRAMYSGERTPEGDAAAAGLTLVADRLPAFYASALRPLIELRKRVPGFVPRTVLLHGAGIGAAAFAVRRAWPDCALQVPSRYSPTLPMQPPPPPRSPPIFGAAGALMVPAARARLRRS